jgi:hypothetical protein
MSLYRKAITAIAAFFVVLGLYCLSLGNNGDALTLFYGALICLVVPGSRDERMKWEREAELPKDEPKGEEGSEE